MTETHTPYTLYIYSVDRIGYNIRYDKNPMGSLTEDLDRLQGEMFGPSVLFERLAMRLLQRFPMPEDAALWLDTDPLDYVRQLQSGVWALKIDPERSNAFLSVLLPLTRAFLLTVYDPQRGVIIQYQELNEDGFIYPPSALADQRRLDPEAATAKFTKASLRKRLLEKLAPTLEQHGFHYETKQYQGIYFVRTVNGALQTINGHIDSNSKPDYNYYDCHHLVDMRTEGSFLRVSVTLFHLRMLAYPHWPNEKGGGGRRYDLVRNFEWADWLAEDILNYGLPILEKARTPEGLDWLYNSPEAVTVFPENIYNAKPLHRGTFAAIAAATQVRNSNFEEITVRVLEQFDKPEDQTLIKLKGYIDECRAQLTAPGNGGQ